MHAVAHTVARLRLDERWLRALGPDRGIVLNFHSISPAKDSPLGPLGPETFESLIAWLAPRCKIRTFSELDAGDDGDRRPFAVLSFDDGYRDFQEYAMPVLDRFRLRANQNVVPSCVESGRPPWNVLLVEAVARLPIEKLNSVRLPGFRGDEFGEGRAARLRFGVGLSNLLKLRSRTERARLIEDLEDQLGDWAGERSTPMLSKREVAEIAAQHEVGLHSYEHDSMAHESDRYFEADLERCLRWSDANLPTPPTVYAFPNGSYRPSQIDVAMRRGLRSVLLVGNAPTRRGRSVHPRVAVYGADSAEVRLRLARAARRREH